MSPKSLKFHKSHKFPKSKSPKIHQVSNHRRRRTSRRTETKCENSRDSYEESSRLWRRRKHVTVKSLPASNVT
jgi:hypothetical protein